MCPHKPFFYLIIPFKATGVQLCCVIDTAKFCMTCKNSICMGAHYTQTYCIVYTIVLQ